jgi:hypothetical protein
MYRPQFRPGCAISAAIFVSLSDRIGRGEPVEASFLDLVIR